MISPWSLNAAEFVFVDDVLIECGEEIERYGIKPMDAMHIACAKAAGCDWFLTTDKGILKKLRVFGSFLRPVAVAFG